MPDLVLWAEFMLSRTHATQRLKNQRNEKAALAITTQESVLLNIILECSKIVKCFTNERKIDNFADRFQKSD